MPAISVSSLSNSSSSSSWSAEGLPFGSLCNDSLSRSTSSDDEACSSAEFAAASDAVAAVIWASCFLRSASSLRVLSNFYSRPLTSADSSSSFDSSSFIDNDPSGSSLVEFSS